MNRDVKPILAIVAVVAVAIIGVMALRGVSTEIEVQPEVDLGTPGATTPTGDPIAVVIARHQEGGGAFLWFHRNDPTSIVTVQFYAPPGCSSEVAQDDPWPDPDPVCASDVAIDGVVSGLGIARTGESIIAVDTEVGAACFDAIEPGDSWPGPEPCRVTAP